MESVVARDSGAAIAARRTGVIDQVDATRIVHPRSAEGRRTTASKSGVDIYRLQKQKFGSAVHLHQPASACACRRPGEEGRHRSPTVPRPISATWRSAGTSSSPSCRGTALQFRGLHPALRRTSRRATSSPRSHEEFEVMARDQARAVEEITRDIPNVSEEALKNLDEAGIVNISAPRFRRATSSAARSRRRAKPDDAGREAARAIFGEKAADVRDTSLRVPAGCHRHRRRRCACSTAMASTRTGARPGDRARRDRAARQGP